MNLNIDHSIIEKIQNPEEDELKNSSKETYNELRCIIDRDSKDFSSGECFLKDISFDDEGSVCLQYSIATTMTYVLHFNLKCNEDTRICISHNWTPVESIKMVEENSEMYFVEEANNIRIKFTGTPIITRDKYLSKEWGDRQIKTLTDEYSQKLQKKMRELDDLYLKVEDRTTHLFSEDNTYNGIKSKHHLTYKLDEVDEALTNKDETLKYEFLIELDKNDPCLGIYYGLRVSFKDYNGDKTNLLEQLRDEWEGIKPKVLSRLNNMFPYKRFDSRLKPTDNANNETFWPFWITLEADENICEVAVRAVIIIRDEYKRYLEGINYKSDETCRYTIKNILKDMPKTKDEKKVKKGKKGKKCEVDEWKNREGEKAKKEIEVHSATRFTKESWDDLLHPWNEDSKVDDYEKTNETWADLIKTFVTGARGEKLLEDNVYGYEKAYRYKGKNATCFAVMMQLLVNRLGEENAQVPWSKIVNQFLDSTGNKWTDDNLKNMNSRIWSPIKKKKTKWDIHEKQKQEDSPDHSIKDFVEEFKKIMG